MYKIIFWDVDNTLLSFDAQERNALKKCFEEFNIGELTEEMLKKYIKINVSYWEALERKEKTREEVLINRFDDFFKLYDIHVSSFEFNKRYQEELGETIVFNDNSFEIVKALKGKYLQYATTNGSLEAQNKKLNKSYLIDLFDGVFISELIGKDKPSKEYFDYVLNHIPSVDKEEMIIIGDSLTSDMLGGVNLGIKTCWYNPKHQENKLHLSLDYEISDLNEVFNILKDN